MEPQIRYVRSADGTIIAVTSIGQGPPLVSVTGIGNISSIAGDMASPYRVPFFEGMSRDWTFVSYDPRGVGLSQREVEDVSLEAHVADLAAVVDSLGPGQFAFSSYGTSAPVAVRYLADHPGRASHFVLFGPAISGREREFPERRRVIAPIFDYDFDLWVRVLLLMDNGWKDGAAIYEAIGSSAVTKEMLTRHYRECRHWDMRHDLARLRCPTLVVHQPTPDGGSAASIASAQQVAATVPGAQFQTLDWDFETNAERQVQLYRSFLGRGGAGAGPITTSPPAEGMAVILFADIADSTALTERFGDSTFRERARALDGALRIAVRDNGGAVIDAKTLGDGILATFPAASQAITAALACGAAGEAQELPLHLGLHAGDVIRERDPGGQSNVYGGAVNIASRVSALSAAGEVLVSRTVRDLARTSAGVGFEDRGEHALKGIGEAVRVYAVRKGGG